MSKKKNVLIFFIIIKLHNTCNNIPDPYAKSV